MVDYLSRQEVIDPQMIESLTQRSVAVGQNRIDEQIVDSEVRGVSYWERATISPYAKAQHYSNSGFTTSRLTANIGVSATLPLFSGTKSRRAEVPARSSLAANATVSTTTSVSLLIESCAMQLNKNLEQLIAASRLEVLYGEQIKIARQAYDNDQLATTSVSLRCSRQPSSLLATARHSK